MGYSIKKNLKKKKIMKNKIKVVDLSATFFCKDIFILICNNLRKIIEKSVIKVYNSNIKKVYINGGLKWDFYQNYLEIKKKK